MKTRLILLLLGLFGLSTACEETTVEYGTPLADFQVKGRVTDAQGNPIRGIEVLFGTGSSKDRQLTDDDGTYTCLVRNAWMFSRPCPLLIRDTDGAENGGHFNDKDYELLFSSSDKIASGSGWNHGVFQKTVDASLSLKEDK